jgi:hypothetical protein
MCRMQKARLHQLHFCWIGLLQLGLSQVIEAFIMAPFLVVEAYRGSRLLRSSPSVLVDWTDPVSR